MLKRNISDKGDFPITKEKLLPDDFYDCDTVEAAQRCLGKILVKKNNGKWIGGIITEVEAYLGDNDPACHAARGMTPRNRVMFGPPGRAYVYFIYGMYHCVNIVAFDTKKQKAGAVLVRSLEPLYGIEEMRKLRKKEKLKDLTTGPGKLCQAMGIDRTDNGTCLKGGNLLLLDNEYKEAEKIFTTTRIGIKEGADRPFRFYLRNNPYISRK